jgi:hypothetical protein
MDISQIEFKLPLGYRSPDGQVHRDGILRGPTVADTIKLDSDPRFQKLAGCKLQLTNPVSQIEADCLITNAMALYFSLTITSLGTLTNIDYGILQKFWQEDIKYLIRIKSKLERKVKQYMKDNGYPFDEYSDEEPLPPGLQEALIEQLQRSSGDSSVPSLS